MLCVWPLSLSLSLSLPAPSSMYTVVAAVARGTSTFEWVAVSDFRGKIRRDGYSGKARYRYFYHVYLP